MLAKRNSFEDWLAWLDSDWFFPTISYTRRGQFVDTDKYDIVPKQSYKKELIERKEKQVAELQEKQKQLTDEIESLKSG